MMYVGILSLLVLSLCFFLIGINRELKVKCKQFQEKNYIKLQESFQEGRLIERESIVRAFKRSETTNEFCDWVFDNYLKNENKEQEITRKFGME